MTMTEPSSAVSTKCSVSFGAGSLPKTICTVYAGPHSVLTVVWAFGGQIRLMSGMYPPCATPSLIRASESSHVEKEESDLELVEEVILRKHVERRR